MSFVLIFHLPDAYCNPLSIGNIEEFPEVNIYPNPTDGILNIEADLLTFNLIKVSSINGVLLKEMSFENMDDLTYLPKGIYFLELISKNSSVTLEAIIF